MIEWVTVRDTTDGFLSGRLIGRVSEIDCFGKPIHFDAFDAKTKPFVHLGSFRTLSLAQDAIVDNQKESHDEH